MFLVVQCQFVLIMEEEAKMVGRQFNSNEELEACLSQLCETQ